MKIAKNTIINNQHYNFFKPVCIEWDKIINEYCGRFKKDVPYYYNERANVSLLAGALWRKKYLAMEEFQIEKRKKKKYTGRSDLWFYIDGYDYYCEAKMKVISLASKNIKAQIKKEIDVAKKDVIKIAFSQKERGLALNFICPYLTGNGKDLDKKVTEFLSIIENLDAQVISWVFPERKKPFKDGNYFYPGIVLLISDIEL